MGEAKRRRERNDPGPSARHVNLDEETLEFFREGPVRVRVIDEGEFAPALARLSGAELRHPAVQFFRVASMLWRSVASGEYRPWRCALCEHQFADGLVSLAGIAVLEKVALEAETGARPALVWPFCAGCDRDDTEALEQVIAAYVADMVDAVARQVGGAGLTQ
jgi:hypothetical protein